MYFRQAAKNTHLVFDNENLISAAGVEPAMRLAGAAGLAELTAAHVRLAGPQAADTPLKAGCLVTGMLMGADSIDDMNLLRDCGLHHVFTEVRAPSTLGSFLRAFDHGTVRQLQAVHRRLLPGLARCCPARTSWPTSTSTPASGGSTGTRNKAPRSAPPGSAARSSRSGA